MRLPKGTKNKEHTKAQEARLRVVDIIDSISPEDLVAAVKGSPSLRGMVLGYIAEEMFEKHILNNLDGVSSITKPDDHDRRNNKSDRCFVFDNRKYSIQLKSIQTNSICWRNDLNCLMANVQNDGSDSRTVILPNGKKIKTTSYKKGDYDILAVPLFPFTGEWNFAYKRNSDCRLTKSKKYDNETRQYLLSTTEQIHYPLTGSWKENITPLLNNV